MKRYEAMMTYAEYTGEPEATMSQDEHGEYVKAEVAQALYDALKELTKESEVFAEVIPAYSNSEALKSARKALSLADGETE